MSPQRPARVAGVTADSAAPWGQWPPVLDTSSEKAEGMPGLRGDLADAMHLAARARLSTIESVVDERHAAFLSARHARAAAEVDELRAEARRDALEIDAWASAETERVREERERRFEVLRTGLETRLTAHEERLQREIARVDEAVRSHRAELASYFERLGEESDPGAIADLVAHLPMLPDLDSVGVEAAPAYIASPGASDQDAGTGELSIAMDEREMPTLPEVPPAADDIAAIAAGAPDLDAAGAAGLPSLDTADQELADAAESTAAERDIRIAEAGQPESFTVEEARNLEGSDGDASTDELASGSDAPAWWDVPQQPAPAAAEPEYGSEVRRAVAAHEAEAGADDPGPAEKPEGGITRRVTSSAMFPMPGVSSEAARPQKSADRVRARLRYIAEHRAVLTGPEGAGSTVGSADPRS